LRYRRGNESEADIRSVEYLYPTAYDARGAARFFEKIEESGAASPPEFLSTHPNPENRVEAIISYWEELGGEPGERFVSRYEQFQNSLP
jgi:predicted Zn-dependent protease